MYSAVKYYLIFVQKHFTLVVNLKFMMIKYFVCGITYKSR